MYNAKVYKKYKKMSLFGINPQKTILVKKKILI